MGGSGNAEQEFIQLNIHDITLQVGDKLFKDGVLYAEITGASDSLYFFMKPNQKDDIASFRLKGHLITDILYGNLTVIYANQ